MASDPHAKAMFSFIDKTKSKTALQFWWFDNEAAFKPELMSALGGEYATIKDTDYCQVYGGWSEQLKVTASAMMGVHYAFVPMNGGFTRCAEAEGRSGGQVDIVPMTCLLASLAHSLPSEMPKDILTEPIIWVSRRQISDMAMYVKGFKHASQAMFDAAPGLLSTLNFVAEDDPNIIWDLRVMTDWQTGFVDHFSPATAPIIMGEMAPYIASWNFPYAVGFCTKAVQEKLIAANPGNAVYTYYNIDDGSMIGSVDFAK